MNEVKKNFSKWMYWFLLAVAIILVYKFLDNFTAIGNAIGKFVGIISPFLAGTLMAYLLYIPASRIEKKLLKSKKKFFKKRARGLSVFITFTFTILLIILELLLRFLEAKSKNRSLHDFILDFISIFYFRYVLKIIILLLII